MIRPHADHPRTSTSDARKDFDHSPLLVFYEVTQACDLVCQHCRACAQTKPHPGELATHEAKQLIDELTQFPKPPMLVLTGGDPVKRPDLFQLIRYAADSGLTVSITPSATPLVTGAVVRRLREAGISRLAISLDGADAETHDGVRGLPGVFDRSLRILADAREEGIPTQVNTTLTPHNVGQIADMAQLLDLQEIAMWSVFFLVPVGRAALAGCLSALQCEAAFGDLWREGQRQRYTIKTTAAPHYRRYVIQQRRAQRRAAPTPNCVNDSGMGNTSRRSRSRSRETSGPSARRPNSHEFGYQHSSQSRSAAGRAPLGPYVSKGVNDGRGVMFVGHTGMVFPSGFMPLLCGMFPLDNVVHIYQQSPIFRALRDANRLEGKCGHCEFRHVCGGSRARAYAVTGNPLAEEPNCAFTPDHEMAE